MKVNQNEPMCVFTVFVHFIVGVGINKRSLAE